MDNETRFTTCLEALQVFVAREGHCRIPTHHLEGDVNLGNFVTYSRHRHRAGVLPKHRASALEQIPGWTWGPLRPGPVSNLRRNRDIVDQYNAGASLSNLAERYDLSRQRIHQIVNRQHV